MESTIKTVRPQVREFDEDLVRRLINTIRVIEGKDWRYNLNQG